MAQGLHVRNRMCYLCVALKARPVRLGVRTQDFHSCNTGSIPVRATAQAPQSIGCGAFLMYERGRLATFWKTKCNFFQQDNRCNRNEVTFALP